MLTALLNLLTECLTLPPPRRCRGLTAQDFLLLLILILSIFLMRESTSIFTLSSHTLFNSRTLFFCLFIHLPMTLSKEECQNTSHTKLDFPHIFPLIKISPTVLFTGYDDKWDFFKNLFLSIILMQELTSIFTLSSLTLVNSGTFFLCLFFHLAMT